MGWLRVIYNNSQQCTATYRNIQPHVANPSTATFVVQANTIFVCTIACIVQNDVKIEDIVHLAHLAGYV